MLVYAFDFDMIEVGYHYTHTSADYFNIQPHLLFIGTRIFRSEVRKRDDIVHCLEKNLFLLGNRITLVLLKK